MNFCKDCRFMSLPETGDIEFARCIHPTSIAANINLYYYVTGVGEPGKPYYCSTMRTSLIDYCGREGKNFEPKETEK